MSPITTVLICGGGAIAHALASVIAATGDFRVIVLTREPGRWSTTVRAIHGDLMVEGPIHATDDQGAACDADLVLVAAPAFAHKPIVQGISAHVRSYAWVGAVPAVGGFDMMASHLAPHARNLFGSLRSPYNARLIVKGSIVEIFGVVPRLDVAVAQVGDSGAVKTILEAALGIPVRLVEPFLAATLSPAGVIFHAARIFELLDGNGPLPHSFYGQWGIIAARAYLAMDSELTRIRSALGVNVLGIDAKSHYGTTEPTRLAARIRSLGGLPNVPPPFIDGRLDASHRFVREDVPFGMCVAQHLARLASVPTPALDEVLEALVRAASWDAREGLALPAEVQSMTLRDILERRGPTSHRDHE